MKKVLKVSMANVVVYVLAVSVIMVSCTKNSSNAPSSKGIQPDSAAGGNVLTLQGSGLGNMRSIVFDNHNVPAAFNPNFNTDNAVIFRVPDTAFGGAQNILFTNADGKVLKVPFKVIALATVSTASLLEFSTGTQITLTGNNLDDVISVVLHGSTAAATIVTKSRKSITITMPATTLARAKLDITNSSGSITTIQEFVSVDNARILFAEDFGTGIYNWSWASVSPSTDFAVIGTHSLLAKYSKDGWQAISLHCDPTLDASQYTFYTFWVKGGTQDNQIDVRSENGGSTNTITVPANVWTYYKFPVAGFITGFAIERLDFQMHGPSSVDQTVYVDDILLVK